jgi:hypothetical protein
MLTRFLSIKGVLFFQSFWLDFVAHYYSWDRFRFPAVSADILSISSGRDTLMRTQ